MAAKLIPAIGEWASPRSIRIAKVSFGFTAGVDVRMTTTGTYTLFTPKDGVYVQDVVINKRTAFNSTGAFTLNIGDTDIDGFIPSTDLVASDAGLKSMKWNSTAWGATRPAYVAGRYYSSDDSDTMAITATLAVAPLSAGKAIAYVYYFEEEVA